MEGILALVLVTGLLFGIAAPQTGTYQAGEYQVTVTGVHHGVAAQPHVEKFNKSRARAEQNDARLPSR